MLNNTWALPPLCTYAYTLLVYSNPNYASTSLKVTPVWLTIDLALNLVKWGPLTALTDTAYIGDYYISVVSTSNT